MATTICCGETYSKDNDWFPLDLANSICPWRQIHQAAMK
ncbi:hypothetical protein COLO4_20568 [Corchorus olitorius]|uniref:Uncharacterized protein n=1 Tax=Corchorus olitorius TaxID=93759 RepID=A0A1R3IYY2_9ROSI|nr:hypothetical protein COLO4_20568 [Corchorus olitorius]